MFHTSQNFRRGCKFERFVLLAGFRRDQCGLCCCQLPIVCVVRCAVGQTAEPHPLTAQHWQKCCQILEKSERNKRSFNSYTFIDFRDQSLSPFSKAIQLFSWLWSFHCTYKLCFDVKNQQDATTFSFINLFKSALHVSGDKFVHPQEHCLTVYTAFGTMHRHCCRPVPRLRWNWRSCIYSQTVLLRMGEFVARNM